jgi:hypothetical protein
VKGMGKNDELMNEIGWIGETEEETMMFQGM